MADVAQAVGARVGALVGAAGGREGPPPCTRGSPSSSSPPPPPPPPPPPHARRYLGDYFARLDEHSDWAGVPPRGQYAAWHAAGDALVEDGVTDGVTDGASRPTATPYHRRPPARALPRAASDASPGVLPPASKKRPRSNAAGAVDAPPPQPLVAPGAKRKKSRGVRRSKAEREARREARGAAGGAEAQPGPGAPVQAQGGSTRLL